MIIISIYLLILNAAGIIVMLADKRKAVNQKYRIPESILLGVALLGGSIGCYLGMKLFRHKTRKPLFSIGIPVIISLQIILIIILYPILILI